jgi:hypothetical protein
MIDMIMNEPSFTIKKQFICENCGVGFANIGNKNRHTKNKRCKNEKIIHFKSVMKNDVVQKDYYKNDLCKICERKTDPAQLTDDNECIECYNKTMEEEEEEEEE